MIKQDYAEDLARAHAARISLEVQLADVRAQRDLFRGALASLLAQLAPWIHLFQGDDFAVIQTAREVLEGVSDQRH